MKTIRNTMAHDPRPQRHVLRNASVLLAALILLWVWSSPAQEPARAGGNLPVKSFEFTTGSDTSGGFYTGKISIRPYCGVERESGDEGTTPIPDGQLRVTWYGETRIKLEQLAGGKSSAADTYNPNGYFPHEQVSAVRIQFDMGAPQEKTRTGVTPLPEEDFPIPDDARKVVSVEIDYPIGIYKQGVLVKETRTLKWDAQETAAYCYWGSPNKFPIEIRGLQVAPEPKAQNPARTAKIAELQSQIKSIQDDLLTIDQHIADLKDDYKKKQDFKRRKDESTAAEAQKLAAARADLQKRYPGLAPVEYQRLEKYGSSVWQNVRDLEEAQSASDRAQTRLSAVDAEITKAASERIPRLDELSEACKKLASLGYHPIKLLKIEDEGGGTLASATLNEPVSGQDLKGLIDDIEKLRSAGIDRAKPAKDKALADFRKEELASIADLNELSDLIWADAKNKAAVEGASMLLKLGEASLEGGFAGYATEGAELISEKIFAMSIEGESFDLKKPGADFKRESAIEKEAEEEFKQGMEGQGNLRLEDLKSLATDEGSFVAGKGVVLGPVVGLNQVMAQHVETEALVQKSELLAKMADSYEEAADKVIEEHLKELGPQLAANLAVAAYNINLDVHEQALWRDYYRHEMRAKFLFSLWQFAAGTYWEGTCPQYEKLNLQLLQIVEALGSRTSQYDLYPSSFPARTSQCSELQIIVVPGDPTEEDDVDFEPMSSRLSTMYASHVADKDGTHQYRFIVPTFNRSKGEQTCRPGVRGDSGYWIHVRRKTN